jgi:MFS family permease
MRARFTGLWQSRDFLKLWSAQTVSQFGSLVSGSALSFTGVLVLKAKPLQMALLGIASLLPGFLTGLVAGVWADRLRRRPIMIAADLGRAVLLISIPAAAFLGVLRIEQLYVVAFLTGVLTTFFDVAYVSYLPSLVREEELLEGNSKLTASAAVAEAGAFGVSGWLVQWLTAPVAVLVDAVSFLVSAVLVGGIRAPEPAPAPAAARQSMRHEIGEGVRRVLGDPVLRAIAGCVITQSFAGRIFGTVYLLYTSRELGFGPGVLGMIWGVGGITSFLGALVAGRSARRLGIGPTMVLGMLLTGLGSLFTPLTTGVTLVGVMLMIANQLVTDPAYTVFEINQVSLRQAVTPHRLLGRVDASIRFAALGVTLAGALIGGLLGETIGLRSTLVVGALGQSAAALWLVLSPVRALKTAPLSMAPPVAAAARVEE